ncbi:G-PROTEIN-RECEP-F1-2 domain-containing protein [Aphelenchoides bicaudatus]|nr:G-PROTEIN-RECEP-F1-2 domain-containing protein [Aphelenchoides bicaudatus]
MGSVVAEDGNPFFDKYKDHELIWPALPGMAIMTGLAVIGLIGNSSVAIVTFKHKRLRSNCNILLSMACIGDSIHQSAHYITSFVLFSGLNFIPLRRCLYLQTLSLIGLDFGVLLTLLIGVDRLISVLFPVKYRRINFKVYITTVLAICSTYSFITIHKAYKFMAERPYAMVTCLIVEAMPGK